MAGKDENQSNKARVAAEKAARMKAALKANLQKRKAQVRQRSEAATKQAVPDGPDSTS